MFLSILYSQIHINLESSYIVSASHNSVNWQAKPKTWPEDAVVSRNLRYRLVKDSFMGAAHIGWNQISWKNVTWENMIGFDWTPNKSLSGVTSRVHGSMDQKYHDFLPEWLNLKNSKDHNISIFHCMPHTYSLKRSIGYSYTSMLQWRHESRFEPFIGVSFLLTKFNTLYQDVRNMHCTNPSSEDGLSKGQSKFRMGVGTIAGVGYRVNKRMQLRFFASYQIFRSIKQDTPVFNTEAVVSVQHRYHPRYWKWGTGIRISV